MDILTAKLGANMAKSELAESGGIGYTGTSAPIVLIPNGSYEFRNGHMVSPTSQLPKVGEKITLTLDDVAYTATAREVYVEDDGGTFWLIGGNTVMIDGVDTGEPFTLLFDSDDGTPGALCVILAEIGTESTTTHTVEVSFATETIHPIDPKYIPSPVVDIDDVIGARYRGETPATSLDDDRVKAIVEGFNNRNLLFKYNLPAEGVFGAAERFTAPVNYGVMPYVDGSGVVYVFWMYSAKFSDPTWSVVVAVYSDGSNVVDIIT